jgi:hypothetical protein
MFFVQQLYQKSLITMHNQRVIIAERALITLSFLKALFFQEASNNKHE